MDEAYSFGLSSFERVELHESDDFFNRWHKSDYYLDYLVVDSDEQGDYTPVYENQKNDVHPPFYYLLLRVVMGFSVDEFTMWGGLALNIVIHLFITVFTYLIIKKLLAGEEINALERAELENFDADSLISEKDSVIRERDQLKVEHQSIKRRQQLQEIAGRSNCSDPDFLDFLDLYLSLNLTLAFLSAL